MQLIVDAEPVSVSLKMSVVQESLPVAETLLNDNLLEPLESISSDAENIPEISSDTTVKEQLSGAILNNIEQEINELLGDDERNHSAVGKLDKEADLDNEETNADKTDNVYKDVTEIEKINTDAGPNTNQLAKESENHAEEFKVNGDDVNYVKDVEEVSGGIPTTEASVEEAELEKVEENGKHLNGLNNTYDNENSVNDGKLINKINDQEIAGDFSETKSVEYNGDSLGEEINKLIADDLDDKLDNIDDTNKIEKAGEFMEVDINNELEKIPDPEPMKTDGETVINDISEEVEYMETSSTVSNQSAEIKNISVADDVKNNSDESNSEEVPSNESNKEIILTKGPNTSHIINEDSLEDFINTTDIKEDPTLNDADMNNINEVNLLKIPTCDKADSPVATDSIESENIDTSIEVTEDNTDITPKSASTEQVIPRKENTISTENVSQEEKEENDSTTHCVLNKENAESHVKVAKWASTGLQNNLEIFSDDEDETSAPIVIDVVNLKETDIEESTSPTQNKLDCPAQDKHTTPAQGKSNSPTQDKPGSPIQERSISPTKAILVSPVEENHSSPAQAGLITPGEDKPTSPAQAELITPREDKPASPADDNKSTNPGKEKTDENKTQEAKECVSLVDDDDNDDIMVIDEDSNYKCNKSAEEFITETVSEETTEPSRRASIEDKTISDNDDDVVLSTDVSEKGELTTESEPIKVNNTTESESKEKKEDKPLVPIDFLNSFKTKMNEMTRADLEEFCLLKIVEGVVDRSNLSDIKAKLKTMMQNVEEWRKKAMVLNKQNRDLQIVLRTVQEEQKKKSDEVITPLKITRSVGMQVLMTDNKTDSVNRTRGQKRLSNQSSNTQPQKPPPKVMSQPAKILKSPIPVPRLVPAQNNSPIKPANTKSSPQVQNSTISSNSGGGKATTPNGIRTYTQTRAAEKRSFSVSIDLTDDEPPPAKQLATTGKGIQNPVRLVPSQQLLAPVRTSIMTHNNSKNSNPRQVYIPIGAPQGNIRPGQTIVFKNSPSVRARQPAPGTIVRASQPSIRTTVPRNQTKHPAPLPQAYSQPQPPNWKALPPAPDLKISKIENGIVVSWKIDGYQEDTYEEIVSYQLYAYQETNAPASTFLWNKIGDIKALPLPMACTLTQFIAGYKYYFAVRAVDIRSRIGPFSLPGSILLLNK